MKKRGVSPVIATVLLIAVVVILAIIIFLWASGFVGERAEKFGSAVELSCDDTNFEVGLIKNGCDQNYQLDILNKGNVPLYGFEIKEKGSADVRIKASVDKETITTGSSATFCLDGVSSFTEDEALVVPVILGQTESGKTKYTCGDQFGVTTTTIL